MAKYRQIHVKIWKDEWFLELEPHEKLFFIYLFSNERASVAGIYELPERVMAFESGLDIVHIRATLKKFSQAKKAYYEDGVVWLVNLRQYHETSSELLQKGIEADIGEVKDCPLKQRYLAYYGRPTNGQISDSPKEPEPQEPKEGENELPPNPINTLSQEGIDRVSIGSNSLDYLSSSLGSLNGVGGPGEGAREPKPAVEEPPPELWPRALASLKPEMAKLTFEQNLAGSVADYIEHAANGDFLVVNVKSQAAADWINLRLKRTIDQTLAMLYGRPLSVAARPEPLRGRLTATGSPIQTIKER